MYGKSLIILAGALLAGALWAAPAAAGDSFHLSLGFGAPVYPYPPVPAPVVVAPPYYYGGVVVVPPPRWHHHRGHYAPPRHYVWSAPPRHYRDGRGPGHPWR